MNMIDQGLAADRGFVSEQDTNTNPFNVKHGALVAFQHFPQPIFLLNSEMELVETNVEGSLAIEKHWVGVIGNKLHFNNHQNTANIKSLVNEMVGGPARVERLVFQSIDMVFRAYTLVHEPTAEIPFLLYIHADDEASSKSRMESLSNAFALTESESKVLMHMVEGLKPKEIAYKAGISLATVRSHLRTLYAKMNVRSANDALKQAMRLLM